MSHISDGVCPYCLDPAPHPHNRQYCIQRAQLKMQEARDIADAVRKLFIITCKKHGIHYIHSLLEFPWDKEE
jgi:hypothetical protein